METNTSRIICSPTIVVPQLWMQHIITQFPTYWKDNIFHGNSGCWGTPHTNAWYLPAFLYSSASFNTRKQLFPIPAGIVLAQSTSMRVKYWLFCINCCTIDFPICQYMASRTLLICCHPLVQSGTLYDGGAWL